MEILSERPPNFDDIVKVFPAASGVGVVFAYAPDIYYPDGVDLPQAIIVHEEVHIERQEAQGVNEWWDQYFVDADFRYNEELLAHTAEYKYLIKRANSRQERRRYLKHVAKKLSSPLYGRMITLEKAQRDIKNGC